MSKRIQGKFAVCGWQISTLYLAAHDTLTVQFSNSQNVWTNNDRPKRLTVTDSSETAQIDVHSHALGLEFDAHPWELRLEPIKGEYRDQLSIIDAEFELRHGDPVSAHIGSLRLVQLTRILTRNANASLQNPASRP